MVNIENLYGEVIFSEDVSSTKKCLEIAVKKGANLKGAFLQGAFLYSANLKGAFLKGAFLPHFLITPETGDFFAFKKLSNNVVVKVLIPAHAARTNSLIGRKCRASEIKVVEVVEGEIPEGVKIKSTTYGDAVYAVGETVKADKWDGDIRVECTHGIHFFMTLREAQEWY